MSDDLDIRAGGAVAVDTATLRTAAARFDAVGAELDEILRRWGSVQNMLFVLRGDAWEALGAASAVASRAATTLADARDIATRLRQAALVYELVDLDARYTVAATAGDEPAMRRIAGRRDDIVALLPDGLEQAGYFTFERTIMWPSELVRIMTEFGWDAGGIKSDGAGIITGVATGVATILAAAAARGFAVGLIPRDARLTPPNGPPPVVRPLGAARTAGAPAGLAAAASRMPGDGESRVRVERYTMRDGSSQYTVYVSGTKSADVGRDEVWDMASNVDLISGRTSASYEATVAALEASGAQPGDVVHAFGHSQGAMITSRLALEGDFTVSTLVSFGSPVEADVGPGTLSVNLRHTDDAIAALAGGGHMAPVGAPGSFVVERSMAGSVAGDGAAPHAMTSYTQTASLVDGSSDPRVSAVREVFAALDTAASVDVVEYGAERVPAVGIDPVAGLSRASAADEGGSRRSS
ncbi:hypothetical protein ACFQZV_02160 [Microbacterium koreense]|uniref:Alpha/beta hydrolase n=1 Tax=Microbacterium koreense TaxID=323761 RepID=A0ABW2ZNM2_9MICO